MPQLQEQIAVTATDGRHVAIAEKLRPSARAHGIRESLAVPLEALRSVRAIEAILLERVAVHAVLVLRIGCE